MSALVNFSMKIDGEWKNFTMSINDETDQYGNNAAVFVSQTKEEREAKTKKTYVGNGKVVYTNGSVVKAEFKEREPKTEKTDNSLPF
jgi:hypothetical protein